MTSSCLEEEWQGREADRGGAGAGVGPGCDAAVWPGASCFPRLSLSLLICTME